MEKKPLWVPAIVPANIINKEREFKRLYAQFGKLQAKAESMGVCVLASLVDTKGGVYTRSRGPNKRLFNTKFNSLIHDSVKARVKQLASVTPLPPEPLETLPAKDLQRLFAARIKEIVGSRQPRFNQDNRPLGYPVDCDFGQPNLMKKEHLITALTWTESRVKTRTFSSAFPDAPSRPHNRASKSSKVEEGTPESDALGVGSSAPTAVASTRSLITETDS